MASKRQMRVLALCFLFSFLFSGLGVSLTALETSAAEPLGGGFPFPRLLALSLDEPSGLEIIARILP